MTLFHSSICIFWSLLQRCLRKSTPSIFCSFYSWLFRNYFGMQGPFTSSSSSPLQLNPLKNSSFLIFSKVSSPLCLGFLASSCQMSLFAFSSFMNLGKVRLVFLIEVQMEYGSFSTASAKGRLKHMNSQRMQPSDHRSTSKEYPLPQNTSGAMQWGVPMMVQVLKKCSEVSSLAVPMSIRCTFPLLSTTEFSGLRSLQTMLLECRYSTEMSRQARQYLVMSIVMDLTYRMTSNISLPWMYSMTRQTYFLSWKALTKPTMQGKMVFSSIFFSWMTVSSISSWRMQSLERHLMAQRLVPNCRFLTRNTCPNWPSPSFFRYMKSDRLNLALSCFSFLFWYFTSFFRLPISSIISLSCTNDKQQQYPFPYFTNPYSHRSVLFTHPPSLNILPSSCLFMLPYRHITSPGYCCGSTLSWSLIAKSWKATMMRLMSQGVTFLKMGDRITAHFFMLQNIRLLIDEPRVLSTSRRLIIEQTVLQTALALPDRFMFSFIEASPKYSPDMSSISFLPAISILTLPSDMMYIVCASSPDLKMYSAGWNTTILMVLASALICLLVRHENSGTFWMAYTFLECYSIFIFWIVRLQQAGFITKKSHSPSPQRMEAVLGHLSRRASSPKVSPFSSLRTKLLSISTLTAPFQMRKKQQPMSPCLNRQGWEGWFLTRISYLDTALSSRLVRVQKRGWVQRRWIAQVSCSSVSLLATTSKFQVMVSLWRSVFFWLFLMRCFLLAEGGGGPAAHIYPQPISNYILYPIENHYTSHTHPHLTPNQLTPSHQAAVPGQCHC